MSQLAFLGRAATFVGLGWAGQTFLPREYVDRINDALRSAVPTSDDRLLRQLSKQVDNLSSSASSRPQTIVVQREGGRPWWLAALLCAGGWLYLRFRFGLTLADLTLVTRSGLNSTVSAFAAKIQAVSDMVSNVRELLSQKIEHIRETVDKVLRDIRGVSDDVSDVKADVDATRSLAESCDKRLAETSAKQDYANRGIHALCAVVGELLQNAAKTPAIENLRSFSLLSRPHQTRTASAPETQTPSMIEEGGGDQQDEQQREDPVAIVTQIVQESKLAAAAPADRDDDDDDDDDDDQEEEEQLLLRNPG
ncbi:hypothetical protein CTAYLR_003762 [Chrysophaeum taylorii]|uniref:DUF1664 domain-containing protein n=1 Tax=Chrysophaeum taylorii TaxID=2483200 RepID=A0AAD7UCY2_9STRA|nr:hypothetical protein CTAYLR_003762 [Chrysophaeum taylorii]